MLEFSAISFTTCSGFAPSGIFALDPSLTSTTFVRIKSCALAGTLSTFLPVFLFTTVGFPFLSTSTSIVLLPGTWYLSLFTLIPSSVEVGSVTCSVSCTKSISVGCLTVKPKSEPFTPLVSFILPIGFLFKGNIWSLALFSLLLIVPFSNVTGISFRPNSFAATYLWFPSIIVASPPLLNLSYSTTIGSLNPFFFISSFSLSIVSLELGIAASPTLSSPTKDSSSETGTNPFFPLESLALIDLFKIPNCSTSVSAVLSLVVSVCVSPSSICVSGVTCSTSPSPTCCNSTSESFPPSVLVGASGSTCSFVLGFEMASSFCLVSCSALSAT